MPRSAGRVPISIAALLLACGGTTAPAPPSTPEVSPDAGAAPMTGVVIQDVAADAGPAPRPPSGTEPTPAAEKPAGVAGGLPAAAPSAEDPLCERHYEELMAPPAKARPPIDCGRVDRLVHWRWTAADGCRDVTRLSLRRSGTATLERSGRAAAPETGGAPAIVEKTLDPGESAALIRAVCQAFNEGYDPGAGVGCPAGSRLVEFFDGNAKSGRTEALPCGSRAMAGAFDRLEGLLERF
jgi:hypothetical protein